LTQDELAEIAGAIGSTGAGAGPVSPDYSLLQTLAVAAALA
jgi:hypothetical protein